MSMTKLFAWIALSLTLCMALPVTVQAQGVSQIKEGIQLNLEDMNQILDNNNCNIKIKPKIYYKINPNAKTDYKEKNIGDLMEQGRKELKNFSKIPQGKGQKLHVIKDLQGAAGHGWLGQPVAVLPQDQVYPRRLPSSNYKPTGPFGAWFLHEFGHNAGIKGHKDGTFMQVPLSITGRERRESRTVTKDQCEKLKKYFKSRGKVNSQKNRNATVIEFPILVNIEGFSKPDDNNKKKNEKTSSEQIRNLDQNNSCRIENPEFFDGIDKWLANDIDDDTFYTLIDAWTKQANICEASNGGEEGEQPERWTLALGEQTQRVLPTNKTESIPVYLEGRDCIQANTPFSAELPLPQGVAFTETPESPHLGERAGSETVFQLGVQKHPLLNKGSVTPVNDAQIQFELVSTRELCPEAQDRITLFQLQLNAVRAGQVRLSFSSAQVGDTSVDTSDAIRVQATGEPRGRTQPSCQLGFQPRQIQVGDASRLQLSSNRLEVFDRDSIEAAAEAGTQRATFTLSRNNVGQAFQSRVNLQQLFPELPEPPFTVTASLPQQRNPCANDPTARLQVQPSMESAATGIELSPNPASPAQYLRLRVPRHIGIQGVELEVRTLAGQRVFHREANTGSGLAVRLVDEQERPLANGIYLYRVTLRGIDGQIVRGPVKKLVVMH